MNYSTGHIYKIICKVDDTICYIGSTFDSLRNRWQQHRKHYKDKNGAYSIHEYFDKYGIENFKMILIKDYLVCRETQRDNKHLYAYETLWINKTKSSINKILPFQPLKKEKQKEYSKEYYNKNKEKIKEYREENKDKINENKKEYNKEYYNKNKDKILEQQKEYYNENKDKILECNKEYQQEYQKEYQKEYYNKNKDKISENTKEYGSKKVECNICGKCMRRDSITKHNKTQHKTK